MRYVGLHAEPTLHADSHASVEYLDGGRWIASDPTFNVTFYDDGRRLGWLEVRERVSSGAPVRVSTNGYPIARSRRIERYPTPLQRLVSFVVAYSDVDGDSLVEPGEIVTAPADWDGTLEDGGVVAFRHVPIGVYRVLGSHPS